MKIAQVAVLVFAHIALVLGLFSLASTILLRYVLPPGGFIFGPVWLFVNLPSGILGVPGTCHIKSLWYYF